MNPELKRIKTALNQLSHQKSPPPLPVRKNSVIKRLATDPSICSFTISRSADLAQPNLPSASGLAPPISALQMGQPSVSDLPTPLAPPDRTIAPVNTSPHPWAPHASPGSLSLTQPGHTSTHLSTSQSEHPLNPGNSGLALSLLKEVESVVVRWQTELRQLMSQIQSIYQEGPIIDGWLESYSQQTQLPSHLADWAFSTPLMHPGADPAAAFDLSSDSPSADYQLCGRDSDGQLWCRPCPPEQIPQISLAIARYQKLHQLLKQKEQVEDRLNQLVQALVRLHPVIQA